MERTTVLLIVAGMISTGTINTLLNKFQDFQCVANCSSNPIYFAQPLLQTLTMFVGEIICLAVYFLLSKPRNPQDYEPVQPTKPELSGRMQILFLLPTLCDLTATTLMNLGLLHISASIYQMLRGSVVLFTGIFSTTFLGIKHPLYRWVALVIVFAGVGIVGMSSLFKRGYTHNESSSFLGIALVVLAQMFTASQFVIEEKIMSKYRIEAVKAVGLEGFFGLVMTMLAVPIFHYTVGIKAPLGPGNSFDMYESLRELLIPNILYASIGIALSIAVFNWCGLAVTQNISATSRSTIDTTRTLFIWMSSLVLGWETFSALQVLGFAVLIYGTFLFNDVVRVPPFLLQEGAIRLDEDTVDVSGVPADLVQEA